MEKISSVKNNESNPDSKKTESVGIEESSQQEVLAPEKIEENKRIEEICGLTEQLGQNLSVGWAFEGLDDMENAVNEYAKLSDGIEKLAGLFARSVQLHNPDELAEVGGYKSVFKELRREARMLAQKIGLQEVGQYGQKNTPQSDEKLVTASGQIDPRGRNGSVEDISTYLNKISKSFRS